MREGEKEVLPRLSPERERGRRERPPAALPKKKRKKSAMINGTSERYRDEIDDPISSMSSRKGGKKTERI